MADQKQLDPRLTQRVTPVTSNSETEGSPQLVWDSNTLQWVKMTQPAAGSSANVAKATAADPVFGEGTDQELSVDLSGHLRIQSSGGGMTDAQFNAHLPLQVGINAGVNNIGDVDVLTLPALPAGTNNIGDVDVLTLPALPAGTNNIGDVDVLSLPAITGTVTANAGTNLNTSALALSATQTDGTQKSIVRGGAKGATAAADVTSTSQGVDHNALDVADGGGSLTVDGPLTDTQLRATPVPVSGTVTASGPLTDTQLRATAVPVTGPLTDTQLRATPVPVSGTVTASGPLTDTQLRATPVPVSGTVTAAQTVAANLKAEVVGPTADNAANPTAKVSVLSGVANAAVPARTEGNVNPLSLDLAGRIRTREVEVLIATTISAANTTITLTIAAAGAGLFHYITSVEIINVNPTVTAIAAAATNLAYTTTNIPGAPAWNCGTLLAAAAEKLVTRVTFAGGIKTTTANTATTFVAPAIGTGGVCRILVTYYIAA